MWPSSQETPDLVAFTEKFFNPGLHFLCSGTYMWKYIYMYIYIYIYIYPYICINNIHIHISGKMDLKVEGLWTAKSIGGNHGCLIRKIFEF